MRIHIDQAIVCTLCMQFRFTAVYGQNVTVTNFIAVCFTQFAPQKTLSTHRHSHEYLMFNNIARLFSRNAQQIEENVEMEVFLDSSGEEYVITSENYFCVQFYFFDSYERLSIICK